MSEKKNILIALAVFALSFVLYHGTLTRFVSENARQFFGYDMNVNYNYLIRGEHSPRHALSTIGTKYAVGAVKRGLAVPDREALIITLAVNAALNVALCFVLLLMVTGNDRITSLLFTLVFCFCFVNLTIFSVPETYALTVLLMLIYFILRSVVSRKTLPLGVSSLYPAVAALNHASLFSLLVNDLYSTAKTAHSWSAFARRAMLTVLPPVGAFALAFLLFFGEWSGETWLSIIKEYASPGNLLSPALYLNVLAQFLFYSIIAPVSALELRIYLADIIKYFHDPFVAAALVIYAAFLVYVVFDLVRNRDIFIDGVLCWLAVMYVMFVYFNPYEPILFSSMVIPGLLIVFSKSYQRLHFRRKHIVFLVFLALMMIRNVSTLRYP